jgi:uncharacterized membrane protein YidH (DUF202 family)
MNALDLSTFSFGITGDVKPVSVNQPLAEPMGNTLRATDATSRPVLVQTTAPRLQEESFVNTLMRMVVAILSVQSSMVHNMVKVGQFESAMNTANADSVKLYTKEVNHAEAQIVKKMAKARKLAKILKIVSWTSFAICTVASFGVMGPGAAIMAAALGGLMQSGLFSDQGKIGKAIRKLCHNNETYIALFKTALVLGAALMTGGGAIAVDGAAARMAPKIFATAAAQSFKSAALLNTGLAISAFNPFLSALSAISHSSSEKPKTWVLVVSMILTTVATLGCTMAAVNTSALSPGLQRAVTHPYYRIGFNLLIAAVGLISSGLTIGRGVQILKLADKTSEFATIQAVADKVGQLTRSDESHARNTNDRNRADFDKTKELTKRFSELTEPMRKAAEILG